LLTLTISDVSSSRVALVRYGASGGRRGRGYPAGNVLGEMLPSRRGHPQAAGRRHDYPIDAVAQVADFFTGLQPHRRRQALHRGLTLQATDMTW